MTEESIKYLSKTDIFVFRLANMIVLASKLMPESNFPNTTSKARNMIKQGAVKVNGKSINNPNAIMIYTPKHDELLLSIGKRKWCKLLIPWEEWRYEVEKKQKDKDYKIGYLIGGDNLWHYIINWEH